MPWLPWLQDCPEYDHEVGLVDLSMFIHMCKFRHLQSKITCASAQLKPEDSKPFITSMLVEIKDWERQSEAFVRGKDDEEGYFSSLWLRRGCAVLEVQLYSMYGIVTATATAAEMVVSLFNACCATCHAFRKVQKSHQLAPQWIDTIFEFQAGVTLLYLIWSKNIASQDWQAAERAVRDCRSTLVILATVAPVVESFINCIDALVTMVFNETQNVPDTAERKAGSEQELQEAMQKAIDAGVAPHIRDMLHEMSKGREII
ncbi:hypothetical protein A1O3_00191 [Capronia epimyces CBS 606.96]|uniref:Uncharacterized protein n=1 Tax=Capronia epimyces CBS 606.96 TaxID=1182542 RepID=W9YQV0_9EURO|nr:uncharacterized protein A1O3_00191 [Capronia epimyces CBS 606.96]EXJ91641.1 hypothetical protein A1O3_00191 [Capronia epimyces CBS 606.96]